MKKNDIFNGDNDSEAWHSELERRGLPSSLKATGATAPKVQVAHLSEIAAAIDELQLTTDALDAAVDEHPKGDSLAHAKHARDKIIPAMNAVRVAGDKLEGLVADDLWPLPTYQEMLFLK